MVYYRFWLTTYFLRAFSYKIAICPLRGHRPKFDTYPRCVNCGRDVTR